MTIRDDNPHPTDRFRHVPGSGSARLEGQRHLEREIRCTLEILDRVAENRRKGLLIMDEEYVSRCPACGDPIDYCQGHGEIGDPWGFRILTQHDNGDHTDCNPYGCEEYPEYVTE
jgi:hypothetical protein